MHPWYGLKFKERKLLVEEMRTWLAQNQNLRMPHGLVRDDGMVFCGYGVGYKNGEHWASREVFEKRLELCRLNQRLRRKDPIYKASYNAYVRNRYSERVDVRQKSKARSNKWGKMFPEKQNLRAAKRRALVRNAIHADHDPAIELAMRKQAEDLTRKTGIKHHIDHIIPISYGGPHHHKNLQILPDSVNFQKSSNPFWTSETYLDFRSVPQSLWPQKLVDFFSAIQKG